MPDLVTSPIDQVLQQSEGSSVFLTRADRAGGWRAAFGEASSRVPDPYWLFTEDEQTLLALGYPLRVSPAWESFTRDLARLIEAEALHRCALALGEPSVKATLVEQRGAVATRLSELLENAILHDHGRRLPEVLWLAISREMAAQVRASGRTIFTRAPKLGARVLEEIRYTVAQRLADLAHRADTDAVGRVRKFGAAEPPAPAQAFARLLRADLLPFAENHIGRDLKELDGFLQGYLKVDPGRFHRLLATTATQLDGLRQRDGSFARVLALQDPESATLPADRLLFSTAVLDLLAAWEHPETPRLSTDMIRLLRDLAGRLRRFEVIATLRSRIYPIAMQETTWVTQFHRQVVRLSSFTRPLDFTTPSVVDSMVRRYGLVYDLVEFTQLIEELRRRGRGAEEQGLRFMARFQAEMEEIRARHRLKFEKFLGDGAFYSARSARAILLAAAELRIVYERLRHQGFPFDRGLRLALSVGNYHLLPMATSGDSRTHFEFFGRGLVELARLTTGKTTHEVEDIADFLISAGYDVHKVLEFLEPVRHGSRYPDHVRERPYAAFLAENGELVNLGGVATETFVRDLGAEWSGPVALGERYGLRWLLLPCDSERLDGAWVGLRFLGQARLKGLDPIAVAEVVVFDQPPDGIAMLPAGADLLQSLHASSGVGEELPATDSAPQAGVENLCVVSIMEDESARTWYIGEYSDEIDALVHAFGVPMDRGDEPGDEPVEAWLFRRRGELGNVYATLRQESSGASVPLESLRSRAGYLTCLLAAPHRSPR